MFGRRTKDIEPLFQDLIDRSGGEIYHLCRVFYPFDSYRRDSLFNDILLRLWLHLEDYRPREGVDMEAWTMRVARNTAISLYRRDKVWRRLFKPLLPSHDIADIDDETTDPLRRRLYTLIETLPPEDKLVVDLYLQRLSHTEIAAATGLTPTNVSTRISRIKQLLKKMNDETEDD